MERNQIPRMLVVVLAVLSLFAIKVSLDSHHTRASTHPRPKAFGAPSFGFAGYTDYVTTSQISAQWRVPRIAANSNQGNASTWIAVESPDGHFLQIGTTEDFEGPTDEYNVFWSDPVVHFSPQYLGHVGAGNVISYSMTKSGTGWVLKFSDQTTSKHKSVTVHYGATTSFNLGQWIQEDPTLGSFNVHLPYPNMSLTTFTHLRINRGVPHLYFNDAGALTSPNGVTLIPSKVRNNQFTFHHAGGAAQQYLQDEVSLATAEYPFDNDAQDNVTPTSLVEQVLQNALTNFVSNLRAQSWPKGTHSDIAGIVANKQRLEKLVHQWPVAPSKLPPQYYNRLSGLNDDLGRFTYDLHARLGLPPPD
jgi:hypothetical protein